MRYLKDTKVAYYHYVAGGRDEYGVMQPGYLLLEGYLWANLKGVDYSEVYAASATWDRPIFQATFTKPSRFEISLGDYLKYDGKLYEIKNIDLLTGQKGRDIKVTCQYDPNAALS